MTLSVCCLTNDPGPRIAAMLAPLRAVADEIVVAADSRVGEADLASYGSVADRLLRVEWAGHYERHLGWLHAQCSGDWILRLDGDEVVGTELLARLPALLADRRVQQYRVPRRWLYPDGRHWLRASPWFPDFQIRLVRNDGTLGFAGLDHTSADPVGPARFLEAPIYHLDLLVSPLDVRRARVERYERGRPGLLTQGGMPVSESYYLPEQQELAPPVEVPAADMAAIRAVLEAGPAAVPPPPAPPVEVVTVAESDRWWRARPADAVDAAAICGRVEVFQDDVRLLPRERGTVFVRVRNEGSAAWPGGHAQEPLVRCAARWLRAEDGAEALPALDRSYLPARLEPGAADVVPVTVTAPTVPGDYLLEVELVHEFARRLGGAARVPVRVAARDGAAAPAAAPQAVANGMRPPVVVLGFHRSGTSVTAHALKLLGVDVGADSDLLEADAVDNPRGYWEPRWMIELNDDVLATVGAHALKPPEPEPGWDAHPDLAPLRERAAALLAEKFDRSRTWGWKDPRTSLTLPLWQPLLGDASYVICVRSPLDALASIEARGAGDADAARMWLEYTGRALLHTAGRRRILVSYDDWIAAPARELARLAGFLGRPVPADDALDRLAAELVAPDLRRNRTDPRALLADPRVPLEATAMYYVLLAARREEDAATADALEDLAAALWARFRTAPAPAPVAAPAPDGEDAAALTALLGELEAARAEADRRSAVLRDVQDSLSWRVTAPLRAAKRGLRRG